MTTSGTAPPLVTVAIPLYHSRRFLDIIIENLQALDYPNLEILIGDRHMADDTVAQLRTRFSGDSRLRFLTGTDELTWVEHYNALLAAATGTYFLWMPHDDSYPAGYIGALVARLEATPDAVLAFGRMESLSVDGRRVPTFEPPPIVPGEAWSIRPAVRMFLCWDLGFSVRGVFRRSQVVDAGLWIRSTTGLIDADFCWMFGVALLGRVEFVPETACVKRFYLSSTSAQWRRLPFTERTRVGCRYVLDYVPARRERAWALVMLWAAASMNFIGGMVNKVTGGKLMPPGYAHRLFSRLLIGELQGKR